MAGERIRVQTTYSRRLFINFTIGLFLGSVVTHVGIKVFNSRVFDEHYEKLLEKSNPLLTTSEQGDTLNGEEEKTRFTSYNNTFPLGQDALSDWLSRKITVLCWIMTQPKNLQKKAIYVKATWGKRCNTILYMSSTDTDFPTIAVVDHEGREHLWQKSRGAFEFIYKHYLDKADWFLKADDDTYVIMENVRKLISLYDPEKPIFFGRKFKLKGVKYMSGGAGYILSRKALKLLAEKAFKDTKLCKSASQVGPAEDMEIGRCLKNAGVEIGDSRDKIYETFHPFVPEQMLVSSALEKKYRWYYQLNYYPVKRDSKCCSDYTISFHYVQSEMMYWLEYMVYQMRPFGVEYHSCPDNIRNIVGQLA